MWNYLLLIFIMATLKFIPDNSNISAILVLIILPSFSFFQAVVFLVLTMTSGCQLKPIHFEYYIMRLWICIQICFFSGSPEWYPSGRRRRVPLHYCWEVDIQALHSASPDTHGGRGFLVLKGGGGSYGCSPEGLHWRPSGGWCLTGIQWLLSKLFYLIGLPLSWSSG